MNPYRKLVLTSTALAVIALGFPSQAPACTVVASPTSDPEESGQLLLAALAGIEQTPCLLRIEPGLYDLAGSTLVLRDQIDVEGSGRGITTIRSTGPGAAPLVDAPAGTAAEIRDLKLLNQQQSSGFGGTLAVSSESARVSRIDLEVDVDETYLSAAGLSASAGRLEDVTIRLQLHSGDVQELLGLYLCSPSNVAPNVSGVRVEFVDPGVQASYLSTYGVVVCGSPTLDRVEVSMDLSSLASYATGIFVTSNSSVSVNYSTVHVVNDFGQAVGVQHNGGTGEIRLSHSAITALGAFGYGVGTGTGLIVEHSTIEATNFSIQHWGATSARIGSSRLAQAVAGTVICAATYDGDFLPLSGSCQ